MPQSQPRWHGWRLEIDGRVLADVSRSHGNWLAVTYFKNRQMEKAQYFSYGEPGSLDNARRWCETNWRRPR